MRIAVISDIHGNLTALEAVLADLRETSPDLIPHGGDLADSGSSPLEVLDRIRDLGWRGVMGNTDEMLVRPEALEEFASKSKAPAGLWTAVREIAAATRSALGDERLAWLRGLPMAIEEFAPGFALIHARPGDCWLAPAADASDAEIEEIYGPLGEPIVAYGHTHIPSIRRLGASGGSLSALINTGSVGLPYDGDPRAFYLLLDGKMPTIRRVEYDVEKELRLLADCGLPGALWTARMLRSSKATLP
jgi:predicted phosphodiesterase